jgi:signal transduction histidine kinase
VSAESTGALDTAWGHVARPRRAGAGIGSFTRSRVERIITITAGIGSLVLGLQAFLAALGPHDERPGWHEPLMVAVFGPLAIMIIACFVGRGVRIAAGGFALLYVLALAAWPIATEGLQPRSVDEPWIWYLVNIATLAAVLAFPLPLQIAWTVLAPVLFGVVRLIQGDFQSTFWMMLGLDVSFALILGGVILTLGWLLRSMAANVDDTRARAITSYADAAAADAAEQERVAMAALMHDSVLAALIAAERAQTPRERTLAATMAREALTGLAGTEAEGGADDDEARTAAGIADDIEAAAAELGLELTVARSIAESSPVVPGWVARALILAATQSVANAVQHAGGVGLRVAVSGGSGQIDVLIADAGKGFDLAAIPDDRLGIRASIIARVAAVGGSAHLDTGPGGTTVRLEWREPES